MHTWSDIAHAQQSKRTPRSGHLAARPAHECAQLRTHDRRAVGGEAPRPIQRARERPDRSAREQSETTDRAELDSAAPTVLERLGAHAIVPARSVGADKCAVGCMTTQAL